LGSARSNIKFYTMPTDVMTDTCTENGRVAYKITVAKFKKMRLFGGPMFRLECSWFLKKRARDVGSSVRYCEYDFEVT